MNDILHFRYQFFPVGQGLFSSGTIHVAEKSEAHFIWVFDCGTSSTKQLLTDAIDDFERRVPTTKYIDLLILSHFDRDHVSGVCDLLRRFKVGTLMLPYMQIGEMLVAAFTEGMGPADAEINFFVNPVDYLTSIAGPGIARIIFVPASGPEGPGNAELTVFDGPQSIDGRLSINYRGTQQIDAFELTRLTDPSAARNTTVDFLRPGTALTAGSLWEFVPYNDTTDINIPQDFIDQVIVVRDKLLNNGPLKERKNVLAKLKDIYDKQFGGSSEDRNAISLSLYAGPIHFSKLDFGYLDAVTVRQYALTYLPLGVRECGLIYTGDAYLNTANKLGRFVRYFGNQRIDRTTTFQVMHHGAEPNWHNGVAAAISPVFSVFCSDPAHQKLQHPNAPVLRDFWPYGPIQVDRESSFIVSGQLGWV